MHDQLLLKNVGSAFLLCYAQPQKLTHPTLSVRLRGRLLYPAAIVCTVSRGHEQGQSVSLSPPALAPGEHTKNKTTKNDVPLARPARREYGAA